MLCRDDVLNLVLLYQFHQMERMQSKVDELEKGRKESDKKYKSQEQKVSEALYCISILGLCITGLTLQDVAKSLRIW